MMSAVSVYSVPDNVAYGQIVTNLPEEVRALELKPENTEAIVREYFKDIPIMIQVARCESTFRHTLADGSVLQGVVDKDDTGVMQINKRYHEKTAIAMGLDVEDLYDNMVYARYLYEKQGVQPWNASRPCWGNALAMNG